MTAVSAQTVIAVMEYVLMTLIAMEAALNAVAHPAQTVRFIMDGTISDLHMTAVMKECYANARIRDIEATTAMIPNVNTK